LKPIQTILFIGVVFVSFAAVSAAFPLKAHPAAQRTVLNTSTLEIWPTGTGNDPTLTPSITQYVGPTFTASGPLFANDPDSLIAMAMALSQTISTFRVYIPAQRYIDWNAWIFLRDKDGTGYSVKLTVLPSAWAAFEGYERALRETRTSLQEVAIGDGAFIAAQSRPIAAMYYRNALVTLGSEVYPALGTTPVVPILTSQQVIAVLQTILHQALQAKVGSLTPTITPSGPLVERDVQMDKVPRTIGNFQTEPVWENEFYLVNVSNSAWSRAYFVTIYRLHSTQAALLVFQRLAVMMTGKQSVNVGEAAFVALSDDVTIAIMRYRNVVVLISPANRGATPYPVFATPTATTMTETLNTILAIIKNL